MRFRQAAFRISLVLSSLHVFVVLEDAAWAQTRDPAVRKAVARGVAFLRTHAEQGTGGRPSLAAYAMRKAYVRRDDPTITAIIESVKEKVNNGRYRPSVRDEHIYESAVDLMLLVESFPQRDRPEIMAIVDYIRSKQSTNGAWDYLPPRKSNGDTSITQYALLGLWAAKRAGIDVPNSAWNRAANWYAATQYEDGGFSYHPGGTNDSEPRLGISAAALGGLGITRLFLFPDVPISNTDHPVSPKQKSVLALLDSVDAESTVGVSQIDRTIGRGLEWVIRRYRIENTDPAAMSQLTPEESKWTESYGTTRFIYYYLYSIERLAALLDVKKIGEHDWYREGTQFCLRTQNEDGSWKGWSDSSGGMSPGTSFAILFLLRATEKTLKKQSGSVGGGLLAGGRGLPDNLSRVQVRGGNVEVRKMVGAIDDLLAELENPRSLDVEAAQQALIAKVQLGDRESLIGQKERLLELVKSRRPEVRRTALWALGRCATFHDAPVLIRALEDPNASVAVEARNALCWLSREPNGFGLPDRPFHALVVDASDSQRKAAFEAWQAKAVKRWRRWYVSVRPYDTRNVFTEGEAGDKNR